MRKAKISYRYDKSLKEYVVHIESSDGHTFAWGKSKELAMKNLIKQLWESWGKDALTLSKLRESLRNLGL